MHWRALFLPALLTCGGAWAQGGPGADEAELEAVMRWIRQRTYERIPSIDAPVFASAPEAVFMRGGEPVVGLEKDGVARAYPVRFLNGREVVNDTLARVPVAVTW